MGLFDRKPPPRERTPEERERARAERAARRAGLSVDDAGIPPPLEVPPPPDGAGPAPAASRVPRTSPHDAHAPRPAAPEGAPTVRRSAPARPSSQARPAAGPPAGSRVTASAVTEDRVAPPEQPAPTAPDDLPTTSPDGDVDGHGPATVPASRPTPAVEAPSVVLDDDLAEDWTAVDAPPRVPLGERLRRKRAGAPPPAAADRGRRRTWSVVVLAVAVATVLAAGWFVASLLQPFHGDGKGQATVVIPRGASVSQAGDLLAKAGVVKSAFFFKLRAKIDGPTEIKSGTYQLPKGLSYSAAFDALAHGPPPAKTTNITITEGRTIREANRLLRKTSLRGSYTAAAARSRVLSPQRYGAPRGVHTKEGFLFPATYQVRVGAPVSDLVTKQLQTFKKRFATVNLSYARSRKLTPYDVLTIASMIEREAAVARDRPLIASVIYNRLKQGIPLGIDATIRYRLDNWSRPLRMSELQADGPYNTRSHQGLPPTPIGNPGLASIRAAARPANTRFLYFVVKPCGKGEHAFAKTDAEFQAASRRYDQARQARGGSPVDC